jgi:hypothetical protein
MKILMLVAALGILYVSFTRAGLDEVTNDEKYDRLRKISVSYVEVSSGQKICYRLPESRTLPNNTWYFLKKIRDDFWIQFSKSPLDKIRIVVLIADKKVYESILMYDDKNVDSIFWKNNMIEAKEKIGLARDLISHSSRRDLEVDDLVKKINKADEFWNYIQKEMNLGNKIGRCYE